MDTNTPVLRNTRFPKPPGTVTCISSTGSDSEPRRYWCDVAVQILRHTKESSEPKDKLECLISKANEMRALNSCFLLPQVCLLHSLPTK